MTDEQIDEVVSRVSGGEGFEAILADMGLNSDACVKEIRAHPTAGTRIVDAKQQQRSMFAARRAAAQQAVIS